MKKTTFETLTGSVKEDFESYPLADIIASYAGAHAGKSISKRDVAALEKANPGFLFAVKKDSWSGTEISAWKKNVYSETQITIRISNENVRATWFSETALKTYSSNVAYFDAKDKRNAERTSVLSPENEKLSGLKKIADLTDALALLHAEIKATVEAYELDSSIEFKVTEILKEKTGNEIRFY